MKRAIRTKAIPTKHEALNSVFSKLDGLQRRGVLFPDFRANLHRLSRDALVELRSLMVYLALGQDVEDE